MSKRSRTKSSRSGTRSRRPRVVQMWEGADLLKHVPDLVAVDTADSLVLVVWGKGEVKRYRTLGAMRVDLLHTDDELALERWAADVLTMALRVKDVIGVAVVVYTPETFAPDGRPPAAQQVRAVCRQAERMGLDIVERFCVAADGWGSFSDPDLPRGGRPLAEIESDDPQAVRPRDAEVVAMASEEAQARFAVQYDQWWSRADGPGGVLHGVRMAEQVSSSGVASSTESALERYRWGRDSAQVIELVERMLDAHEHDPGGPCPCRSLLFALAERQGIENLVLVQFAWGRGFAKEVWRAADTGDPGSSVVQRLMTAITGGAFRRPDVERIDRAVAVLLEVASYVPEPERAPIDGMLAWLHWACGGGSAAAAYARRALLAQPGRDIPTLVLTKTRRSELPLWAFRKNAHRPDPFAVSA